MEEETKKTGSVKTKDIKETIDKWDNRCNWDDFFMCHALLGSSRSSCNRLHVGCVLVKDKRIISTGYNGFISGAPHKSIIVDNHEQATVHAEQNAISDCAKRGISCNNSIAYITHYPCINCTKILISSGIKKIYYNMDYKNNKICEVLLNDSNVEIVKL